MGQSSLNYFLGMKIIVQTEHKYSWFAGTVKAKWIYAQMATSSNAVTDFWKEMDVNARERMQSDFDKNFSSKNDDESVHVSGNMKKT